MYVLYIFFKLIIDKKQGRERIDRCYLNKKWILSSSFLRFYLIEDLPSLLLVVFAKQLIIFFGHLVSNLADNSDSISCNRCDLVSRILWIYSKRTVKRLRIIDECGSEALTNCKKKEKKEMNKSFKLISNYWVRLSMISWIINTEIWVVFWSQRTREITQTQTQRFMNRDFMWKPNSILSPYKDLQTFENTARKRDLETYKGYKAQYKSSAITDVSKFLLKLLTSWFPLYFDPNVYLYILFHFQWIQVYMYSCKTLWYCCKTRQSCIYTAHEHIRWYLKKKK